MTTKYKFPAGSDGVYSEPQYRLAVLERLERIVDLLERQNGINPEIRSGR